MSTRAHTVPKFYLTGFIAPGSEHERNPFVWVGSLVTGEVTKRSPKNISISRGLYDGHGCFEESEATIEKHLARIESAASSAIRKFAATKIGDGNALPAAIIRFLAWQVARTPGWMSLEQGWVNDPWPSNVLEPPPDGFNKIRIRNRAMHLENPDTGEKRQVTSPDEFFALHRSGWKWLLKQEDHLELLHLHAWYLQVRHFPRLSWFRIEPPDEKHFITSDRAVAWLVDGVAHMPPGALRHPAAQVVAPLTKKIAFIGQYGHATFCVTPREVNRSIALAASNWIAGPTAEVVQQAIKDRHNLRQ